MVSKQVFRLAIAVLAGCSRIHAHDAPGVFERYGITPSRQLTADLSPLLGICSTGSNQKYVADKYVEASKIVRQALTRDLTDGQVRQITNVTNVHTSTREAAARIIVKSINC